MVLGAKTLHNLRVDDTIKGRKAISWGHVTRMKISVCRMFKVSTDRLTYRTQEESPRAP